MVISIIILIIDCIILIVLIRKAGHLTHDITFSSKRNVFNIIINGLEYGLIFWLLFMGIVFVAGILILNINGLYPNWLVQWQSELYQA